MARVTITVVVEGDVTEVDQIREALRRLPSEIAAVPVTNGAAAAVERERPSEWTREELERFWSGLRPGAREVLAEVAKRPDRYPMDELERTLGVPARTIGGRLSSVGFGMRRFRGKPEPIHFHHGAPGTRGYYTMDPRIAEMLREIVAEREEGEAA